MKYKESYLVTIQFLGFRFHGWQKQRNVKTVHEMVDKTLLFVFRNENFKTIGVGRTDSKVSANTYIFQLFTDTRIDVVPFLAVMNSNLPSDIRAQTIKPIPIHYNIIQQPKLKEYLYFFSFGEKNHPFSAPFIVGIEQDLDLDKMKKGAQLFEGEHFFNKYCTQPTPGTQFKRTIKKCEIQKNTIYTANFFPEHSYLLRVKGIGFLRYQIRLMMAVLFEIGKGTLDLAFIEESLKIDNDKQPLKMIAPSSGLQLYSIELME